MSESLMLTSLLVTSNFLNDMSQVPQNIATQVPKQSSLGFQSLYECSSLQLREATCIVSPVQTWRLLDGEMAPVIIMDRGATTLSSPLQLRRFKDFPSMVSTPRPTVKCASSVFHPFAHSKLRTGNTDFPFPGLNASMDLAWNNCHPDRCKVSRADVAKCHGRHG